MKRCALEGAKLNVRNLFRRYEPNICFSGRQKSRIRSEANQAEWGCQSSEGGGNKSTEKKGYWHLTVLLFYQTGSSSILSSSTRPHGTDREVLQKKGSWQWLLGCCRKKRSARCKSSAAMLSRAWFLVAGERIGGETDGSDIWRQLIEAQTPISPNAPLWKRHQ